VLRLVEGGLLMVVLRVEEIKKKPREISFSEPSSAFVALHEAELAGECRFLSPVSGVLRTTWEYDHVRVQGDAACRVQLVCARCLSEFELELDASFVVYYSEAIEGAELDDEIELAEQDLLSASYAGDEIQVAQEIGEQLLMAMPAKPLCDERCHGLCASCGVDLNSEACSCEQQSGSFAFSALQKLTVPRKGE
jgi:uncharacterized protein